MDLKPVPAAQRSAFEPLFFAEHALLLCWLLVVGDPLCPLGALLAGGATRVLGG